MFRIILTVMFVDRVKQIKVLRDQELFFRCSPMDIPSISVVQQLVLSSWDIRQRAMEFIFDMGFEYKEQTESWASRE